MESSAANSSAPASSSISSQSISSISSSSSAQSSATSPAASSTSSASFISSSSETASISSEPVSSSSQSSSSSSSSQGFSSSSQSSSQSSSLPPANGALARVSNTSCIAPEEPVAGLGTLSLTAAFPNLPALSWVLGLYQSPGNSSHWYAVLRDGDVVRFANNSAANSVETFISLPNVRTNFEMGLLDIAFHPNFASNGEVFVSYNDQDNGGRTTLSRLTYSGSLPIDNASEEVILTVNQPADNHNGGQIAFGSDGYLYIGLGDGGANASQAQNTATLLGALLRIDVDNTEPPRNYAIPPGNPFVGNGDFAPEIYAYGLRNPWRWSFDSHNGDLWLADVGQSNIEEVNRVSAGNNLGWNVMEGDQCYGGSCSTSGLTLPLLQYTHSNGHCSITGGYVYRGSTIDGLTGNYLFSDWCTGVIWRGYNEAGSWQMQEVADAWFNVPAFGQGHDGEVYVLNPSGGAGEAIYQITENAGTGQSQIPENLSDTGCYDSTVSKTLAASAVPYDVHAALWSDGAAKRRAFAIPDGSEINLAADGDFQFPVGSVLIKEFLDGNTHLETRLFMRHQTGWAGYSYQWLNNGSDAVLLDTGKTEDTGNFVHTFPSPQQCQTCHTSAAGFALGLEAVQLNREFTYPATGLTANQLSALYEADFLASDPEQVEHNPLAALGDTNASLEKRARSYLHSNCSGCHRPGSTSSGIDLRIHTSLDQTGTCNATPNNTMGLADARIIAPGNAASSTLLARMQSENANTRMPPLASLIEDQEATLVIANWIDSLEDCQ
ncbi:MAG TPA: PQQ-dependent sugar dehydrogenase [Cellvibrionaceae bacterium]